jgi:hypothetical protein
VSLPVEDVDRTARDAWRPRRPARWLQRHARWLPSLLLWALPLLFLGIELWTSAAAHDFNGAAIWRSIISAGAQTLLFWPGALAGHYAAGALRAGAGGPGGKT